MRIIVYKTKEIEKILTFFKDLPDNWDSFGSPRIGAQTIYALEKFVSRHFKLFYLRNSICAVPGGGINLDFVFERKALDFEIFPNGLTRFEQYNNNEQVSCPDVQCCLISMDEHLAKTEVNKLLAWLMN